MIRFYRALSRPEACCRPSDFGGAVNRGVIVRVLLVAVVLPLIAFLIHLVLWRIRTPKRQSAALLVIFVATLCVCLVSSPWWPVKWQFHNAWEVLQVSLHHVAMMLAYVVAYSALEERSPSMTILTRVADAGNRGMTREDLQALLVDISPVETRLAAMQRDAMVQQQGEYLRLSPKGWAWATTFSTWRRILRFRLGG